MLCYQRFGARSPWSLERVLTGTETTKSTRAYHKQRYWSNESGEFVRSQEERSTASLEGLALLGRKNKEVERGWEVISVAEPLQARPLSAEIVMMWTQNSTMALLLQEESDTWSVSLEMNQHLPVGPL